MPRRATVIAFVLTAALLASCRGSKSDDTATVSTPSTRNTSTTVAVSSEAAALETILLKDLPDGYIQEPDDVGDTGPSDLAKAVRDDGNNDAEAVLTTNGFVAAYQRLWTKGDGAVVAFVTEFKTPAGAQAYRKRLVAAASETDDTTTVTEFAVTGIPGAMGYAGHSAGSDSVVVVFSRGTYAVQIVVNGLDANPTLANSLATQQYNLAA